MTQHPSCTPPGHGERPCTHGQAAPSLAVRIGSLHLANPVLTASGTFGYGREFAPYLDLERLGGVVTKGISWEPRPGNRPPRVVETPCGMLNAIGLENVGLRRFVQAKLPYLRRLGTRTVVNILGNDIGEYQRLASALAQEEGVDAIEVNISCPNVKAGGVAFGTSARSAAEVTAAVRAAAGSLPVIVKLSPNVTDITAIARAVADAGADALSLVNTLLGMAIDVERRRPVLGNVMGGLSGPAIRPVAVRMVWQVAQAVDIPVIGIGGISSARDALEFILAGATAVQVGTANFVDPATAVQVVDGIAAYLCRHNLDDVQQIVGAAARASA